MKKRLAIGLVVTAGAIAAPASAQSLRPNILFIFDTSGSMQLDATETWAGERINEQALSCTAPPVGAASRLFSLKAAIRDTLAEVGTDEANFGLMSFPQLIDPALTQPPPTTDPTRGAMGFGCFECTSDGCGTGPVGHYYVDSTVGLGCRLSSDPANTLNYTAAEPAYGPWFDSAISQALRVDLTKAAPGTKPAAADFDPADANIARLYSFMDDTENVGPVADVAHLTDPELHANGATPLGRSLFYARLYFDNFINTATDPRHGCRQSIVIVVTDGNDTCDYTSGSALNYQTCAQTGFATFHPEVQACKLLRSSNVKTYVLTDTTVTGSLNSNIAIAGGTTDTIKVSLTDTAAVKAALIGIIASTVPPAEICNGKDDNCNGLIDEGVSNMCPHSNSATDADNLLGTAAKHCAVESCNCKDDNCNGVVDEGLPTNACGGPCGCAVPAEICDGIDNNCDGQIDEGFLVGSACTNGELGACRRGGALECNASGGGTMCDAPTVTPGVEVCNNIDDDCNGKTDDGVLPGVGEACGSALGVCMAGITACVNGHLVCEQMSNPMPEVCNGKDDDCNGVIDDGVLPGVGDACLCAGETQAQVGIGVCKAGKTVCRNGGIACDGCVGPSAEICDGKDNDCDGKIDTTATCPSNFACREGSCTLQCATGEFPCPAGYMCVGAFCIPQRCIGVTCGAGQKCDNDSGQCVDLCSGVTCTAPSYCKAGNCVDCNTPGESCAAGQSCVGGACQSDPCSGVTCTNGTYCSAGTCVALCTHVDCAASQRCVAGKCVSDPCATVSCGDTQYCDMTTGQCKTDTCAALQCPAGQRCIQSTGACAPDPCNFVQCPAPCYACDVTSAGQATCKLLQDAAHPMCQVVRVTTGEKGGGCACDIGATPDPSSSEFASRIALGLGLLGLAMTVRPRRRRRTP
ncbi:MAG TPA: MopE-related protein [Polyangia bacterium]|jgi:hypothetical protein|nr:MopE-related protein [Polyangia bacterium]